MRPDYFFDSAENQDLRQCITTDIEVNSYAWSELYFVGHTARTEPTIVLNIILLNFTSMVFLFSTEIE